MQVCSEELGSFGVPTGGFVQQIKPMMRVLVAESSRIHTSLLAESLTRDRDLEVIPFESDLSGLLAEAAKRDVDVLVINSKLDERPSWGFEMLRELRAVRPDVKAVVLLDSSKDECVLQAFRAGARGVFDKNQGPELLRKCVRCVAEGEIWANSQQLDVLVRALADSPVVRATNADGLDLLSERELQVVHCLAEGLTNREIAERLHLSQHTVKNYLFRVFDKLGVSSRVELLSMTLTRSSSSSMKSNQNRSNGYSPEESDMIEKLADAGLPAAQLALAQLYLARRNGPEDLVDAYMWYLIAIERAGKAKDFITNMMSSSQLEEAARKAADWSPVPKQSPSPSKKISLQPKRPDSRTPLAAPERNAN